MQQIGVNAARHLSSIELLGTLLAKLPGTIERQGLQSHVVLLSDTSYAVGSPAGGLEGRRPFKNPLFQLVVAAGCPLGVATTSWKGRIFGRRRVPSGCGHPASPN